MNELNKLYKAILMTFGAVVRPSSQIVMKVADHEYEVKVDDMHLYLPTSDVLASTSSMDKVYFHPACETVVSKETEVFKIIRRMAGMRLLELFKKYPPILQTIAKGAEKRSWNQNTLDILEPFKNVKKSVMQEVSDFMGRLQVENAEGNIDNRFIHLKVSKGSGRSNTGSGERVYHRTKPVFPVYNEIVKRLAQSEGSADNQTVEFNGYSISRAALKLIAHIHRAILPAVNDPDNYEAESTSPIASRLVSFLGCFEMIANQFNRVQNTFRSEFDKLGVYAIDLSWTEQLENLPEIYNQVPNMPYNTNNTQEEAVNKANAMSNMGGMFSVNSNGHVVQGHQHQNAAHVGVAQPTGPMIQEKDGYVLTPPVTMEQNDQWLKVEIDYQNNKVIHHAMNKLTGQPVVYICTRMGTQLQRTENTGMVGNTGVGGINPLLLSPLLAGGGSSLLGNMGGGVNPQLATLAALGQLNNLTPLQQIALLNGGNLNSTPASSSSSGVVVDYNNVVSSPTY